MSNRWERGIAPPYTLSKKATGGTVIASYSTLVSSDTGASQLSLAGQFFPHVNPLFHQGDGEASVSGYVTPSGQTISRSDFPTLFSRLSTTWGSGNGSTTFTLPSLNGGPNFISVGSPATPKPVGTVLSGNFSSHTHPVQVSGVATRNQGFNPNSGSPFGFDDAAAPIAYTTVTDAFDSPSPGTPVGISDRVRVNGVTCASTLAVKEAEVLPIGTIIAYIGVSTSWSNTTFPWLLCDGTAYSRQSFPLLYLIIGTNYGTTSSSDFKVPDFRGRFMYNSNQYTGQYDNISVAPTDFSSTADDALPNHFHSLSAPFTMSTYGTRNGTGGPADQGPAGLEIGDYGTGPKAQLVPPNASVLWLIKAS